MLYHLNVGSNLGERRDNLMRAVAALARLDVERVCRLSTIVQSAAWGYSSAHNFLNVGVAIASPLDPHTMLSRLHDIERQLGSASHRTPDGHYADRVVDIDIVAIDEQVIDTPTLQVPHPHLPERLFFLIPLAQLAPAWRHPVLRLTPQEMIAKLPNT